MSLFLLESVFGLFCLMVRTLGFHPKNRSSILLQATNPAAQAVCLRQKICEVLEPNVIPLMS